MNSTNTVKGAGRGRTKGSFSFITVPAEKLTGLPQVVVSRKWAEAVGIAGDVVAKSSLETLKVASVTVTETPVLQVEVED
jgi:RNase P/RNase MRP subunit p29